MSDKDYEYVCVSCRKAGVEFVIPMVECRIPIKHFGDKAFFRFSPSCRRHPDGEMVRVPAGSTEEWFREHRS